MAARQAQGSKANPILINDTPDDKSDTESLASCIFDGWLKAPIIHLTGVDNSPVISNNKAQCGGLKVEMLSPTWSKRQDFDQVSHSAGDSTPFTCTGSNISVRAEGTETRTTDPTSPSIHVETPDRGNALPIVILTED